MEAHASALRNADGELITGAYVITTQKILRQELLVTELITCLKEFLSQTGIHSMNKQEMY